MPQHSWNDPRLYYFGPFRTGGDVFYGDVAGNPITRGNAQLGQIAGYGPANGGFGGPHFDAVGGFHDTALVRTPGSMPTTRRGVCRGRIMAT